MALLRVERWIVEAAEPVPITTTSEDEDLADDFVSVALEEREVPLLPAAEAEEVTAPDELPAADEEAAAELVGAALVVWPAEVVGAAVELVGSEV